jgi:hypothetical protein
MPYVPAPAGQEALVLLIYHPDREPTADDIQMARHPVVAWAIDPQVIEGGGTRATPVLPVAPLRIEGEFESFQFTLITLAEGRLYSPDEEDAFERLDDAIASLLPIAQASWHRRQARKAKTAA